MRGRLSRTNLAALAIGIAFLYLPIVILVIYSFNDSRLVTVWGGWSLRWYRALLDNDAMLEAAQGWKRAFPDGRGTVLEAYSDGPVAVLEILWEGTNTGPMETPTGDEMPATGKQARVKACQVFEVEEGRVKGTRHYFNLMSILAQLGVGAPGTAAVA